MSEGLEGSELEGLEERLRQHSSCFSSMVELIPARFYVVREDDPQIQGKYWLNRKERAPKQAIKEASKKAKRLKLDPEGHRSEAGEESDLEIEGGEIKDEENGNSDTEINSQAKKPTSVEKVRSGDLKRLREKLHDRIEQFQKRKENPDEIAKKRQKRMERKQRKKELRKKDKTKKQNDSASLRQQHPSNAGESGQVLFSKLDFTAPSKDQEPTGKKKDYKRLLTKAEAKQRKLEELKKKGDEQLHEKLNWQRAVEMAKGTKLKDDPKLLKRTIKRLEKKKAKSKRQWKDRTKQEVELKEKRQGLRRKHIQERIEKIKAKKMKKRAKKKGRA